MEPPPEYTQTPIQAKVVGDAPAVNAPPISVSAVQVGGVDPGAAATLQDRIIHMQQELDLPRDIVQDLLAIAGMDMYVSRV